MDFGQTLISTLAAALITGLVVVWWKENERFKRAGTILFVALCVLWGSATLYGIVYGAGALDQWKADQKAIGDRAIRQHDVAQRAIEATARNVHLSSEDADALFRAIPPKIVDIQPIIRWNLPTSAHEYLLLLVAVIGFLLVTPPPKSSNQRDGGKRRDEDG